MGCRGGAGLVLGLPHPHPVQEELVAGTDGDPEILTSGWLSGLTLLLVALPHAGRVCVAF